MCDVRWLLVYVTDPVRRVTLLKMNLTETLQRKCRAEQSVLLLWNGLYFSNLWHQTVEYSNFRHFGHTKQTAHCEINITILGLLDRKMQWTKVREKLLL